MFKQSCWSRLHISFSPTIVLLLLVCIAPVVVAEPTSYNDPFRTIALQVQKPSDPPICCLKPLHPLDSVEDDLLVSFEEWKARHLPNSENVSSPNPPSSGVNKSGDGTGNVNGSLNAEDTTASPPTPAAPEDRQELNLPAKPEEIPAQISPHFRVPLVDRFNYASLDCSARIYKAHKGAKSPSSVLASKKDRYMLSPCKANGEKQFIVIELCEDIRIDTVQLANFEFFSGVFKEFTISVRKTSSQDETEWKVAGTYKAKNIRGIQSFHTPTSLRDFYRYLRIDFHSHYGSEFYCPLSLVRVYGLTHLEEWKWELWEAESRAKLEAALKDSAVKTIDVPSATGDAPSVTDINQNVLEQTDSSINETETEVASPSTIAPENAEHSTDTHLSSSTTITQPPSHDHHPSPLITATNFAPPLLPPTPGSPPVHPSTTPSHDTTSSSTTPHNDTNGTTTTTTDSPSSTVTGSPVSRPSSPSIVLTPTPLTTHSQPFLPITISGGGGESIYRTIMNRVIGIERNHTLYKEYMAQQQLVIHEALKRLGEDIGRLEGLGKVQRQAHDRTVLEWEKQRKQWQMEHAQILQRLEYLSDEIIMEKRLGVAQLCLLLAVLVFMGLTRGSRGPVIEDRGQWQTTLKSWSGDWQRPRIQEAKDSQAFKRLHLVGEGEHIKFSKNAPTKTSVDTVGSSSSTDANGIATEVPRYPPTTIDLDYPFRPQHRTKRNVNETHLQERGGQNTSLLFDSTNTPSHIRSPTISRSRSRTSSWPSKSILFHPTTPSSRHTTTEPRVNQTHVMTTPSRVARTLGGHLPSRPGLPSVRSSPYAIHQRRGVAPLQRSHSSHGPSSDYTLGQTWTTGSGIATKSARKWARTAHLHEVRGRWKENFGSRQSPVNNGAKGDENDVFGGSSTLASIWAPPVDNLDEDRKLESSLLMRSGEPDADAEGWESASDVDFDSMQSA